MVLEIFDQMNRISAALRIGTAVALLSAAGIAPALAGGYTTSVTDTVKLDVQGAGYSQTRTGSTYSVGGNNVESSSLGGLGTITNKALGTDYATGVASVRTSVAPTVVNSGTSFSFSESAYVGDAVGAASYVTTGATGTATTDVGGTIAPNSNYGQVTTSTGGVKGALAGTLTTTGGTGAAKGSQGTVTAGGAGTSATLQRSIELTVFQ